MRVLLAYPFFLKNSALEREWMMPYFPLGILYLASVIRQAGHEVAIFDGTFATSENAFDDMLATFQPDVVCIASLVTIREIALAVGAKSTAYGAQVIYGGADPSVEPAAYLQEAKAVVLGEGDQTVVELLTVLEKQTDLAHVAGIAYRNEKGIHKTAPREPIWDLDSLPLPSRHFIDMPLYMEAWRNAHGYSSVTLAVSRGCPYGCDYCVNGASGPHFRRRSPQSVAQEMRILENEFAPDCFRLVDDLEGLGEEWLVALGQAMQMIGVTTPYEGLMGVPWLDLPMYKPMKGLCGKRNRYIPRISEHPHAPPISDLSLLQERWGQGVIREDA